MTVRFAWLLALAFAVPAAAQPTRSSPVAVAGDGPVFVVNPDQDTVARLEFDAMDVGTLTHEAPVGRHPRTLAVAGAWVFTADQRSDTVSRRNQADLGGLVTQDLGRGCAPYGVAPLPDGRGIAVSCQGTSELVLLDLALAEVGRVALAWSNARAIAITADGTRAYVTHFLTEEPTVDAHVTVVDLAARAVATVFAIPPDAATCETQNSGQGVLNIVNAIAIVPAGPRAGQVWVGGTQQNNVSKGLFKRDPMFKDMPGAGLFPHATFGEFAGVSRNIYKPSFHDITRSGIYKLDGATGEVVGKIDVDEANNATDIEFSADGATAYVVDLMFNSYHLFPTDRGEAGDVTTLFAAPASRGPGGADPTAGCLAEALRQVTNEAPFRRAPQAQLSPIDGYDPLDRNAQQVNTGVDFDTPLFMQTGTSAMRLVPDAVGTAPIGVRAAADGETVYVFNYLARNVVPVASAYPVAIDGATREHLRCIGDLAVTCGTNNDCAEAAGKGFCNHPGGPPCTTDADCGANGPCIRAGADCVPLVLGQPVATLAGGLASDALPPALLDGKILFNTAARDASVPNGVGLRTAAPLFNDPSAPANQRVPGSVVSTSHDASYVTCTSCHADFGGQDGRTWDFSQLGASLRNTMDLRGRSGFAPGTCSAAPATECFFDAACGDGGVCRMNPALVPPNVPAADAPRYFNPMLTVHWNGDRDEVEDFEHTFRQLQGASDCDGIEDLVDGCLGGLVQRSSLTSSDPVDVHPDLGAPNRNLRGLADPSKIVGIRLSHMADFVYSLTDFVVNPNAPTDETEAGRRVFADPATQCASCHNGGPGAGRQFFTDKGPNPDFDVTRPGRPDQNNPFIRHDVGTANLFDETDPYAVALERSLFHNPSLPIPGSHDVLNEYVTPALNDLWNTRPYLHDGSAHFLLDVVRSCDTTLEDCGQVGRGRNLRIGGVERHGATSFLTPAQLNALTAFQEALTIATTIGTTPAPIRAGALTLKRVVLAFPKTPAGASRTGGAGGRFAVSGTLGGAAPDLDPSGGATLSLATPGGERMAIVQRTVTLGGTRARFRGKTTDGGVVKLNLKRAKGGRWRVAAAGKGVDLTALDTGNRELTVALETGGMQFVQSRVLGGKRNVFKLPQRRKR